MTEITEYQLCTWGTHNKMTQSELNKMAKKIAISCTLNKVYHHSYSTNNPEQLSSGEEMACICTGSMAFEYRSEVLPVIYSVHFDCGNCTEIVEIISR